MKEDASNDCMIVPEPTLRRLPWYLAYVSRLRAEGVESVSSTRIAESLRVDASQIVKDLSRLDIRGKTRIGYNVADLEQRLEDVLGFRRRHNAVIVGVGSLGSALIADSGLQNYGLNIVAGFDVNAEVVDRLVCGIRVYPVGRMAEVSRMLGAEIGILTVPPEHAQGSADALVKAGMRALWNFTPRRVTAPDSVVVQNISIYAHLAVMYNRLDRKG